MKKEIIILLTIPAILINLTLILASNSFEDIFSSSFDIGVLGFILNLIPAMILLIITYISFKKASRSLMTIQLLLWWIFTIYVCLRAFAFLNLYLNLGFMPKVAIDFFTINNVPIDENQHYWYVLSIFINAGIGLIMSFGNGIFMKFFTKIR